MLLQMFFLHDMIFLWYLCTNVGCKKQNIFELGIYDFFDCRLSFLEKNKDKQI